MLKSARRKATAGRPVSQLYSLATEGLFIYGAPLFWGYSRLVSKTPKDFSQRLGLYPGCTRAQAEGAPKIWIHASSVGEVGVAKAVSDALKAMAPEAGFVISAGTHYGRERARVLFGDSAAAVYAPLDFKAPVQKALRWFRPDVLVLLETELWPQWILQAANMGIPTVMANGRISSRSIKSYLRFKSFFTEILGAMSAFSMISLDDAQRIKAMGARPGRIAVNGNAKYDFLADHARSASDAPLHSLLPQGSGPVIVAGSTRNGEEEAILDMMVQVRKKHPNATLILAPRHIERTAEAAAIIQGRGLAHETFSALEERGAPLKAPVLLVDRMGCLLNLYSLADVVFCGASLVELGGQNVLEPASWGKPVLYGPHMDDFAEARDLLEAAGGGRTVRDWEDLTNQMLNLLSDSRAAKEMGARALSCIQSRRGAAARHAAVIRRVIG